MQKHSNSRPIEFLFNHTQTDTNKLLALSSNIYFKAMKAPKHKAICKFKPRRFISGVKIMGKSVENIYILKKK